MRRSIPPERLAALPAGRDGLSDTRAGELRARYGDNDIVESSAPGWPALLRETARDPMLWFLLATAALFGGLGDIAEAVTLVVAMVPLVGMDLFLHRRTQASTQGLRGRLANTAEVLRDGRWQTLPAPQLVPGDLVRVGAGDALPADGLFVSGDDVQIDESALTGEAYPVRKRPGGTPGEGDEDRWAFAGTRLLTAQAEVRVVFTGAETLYGEIVRSATRGRRARTPLQLAIANLVTILVVATAIMCPCCSPGSACSRASGSSTPCSAR
ncbi:MAG: cation-transporting P-type ATPase [Gammaproteobacteria bacterium]